MSPQQSDFSKTSLPKASSNFRRKPAPLWRDPFALPLVPHSQPLQDIFVRQSRISFGKAKPSPELERLLGPSGFFCDGSGLSDKERANLQESKEITPAEAEFRKHYKTVLDLFISHIQDEANKTGKRLPVVVTLDENHKHQKLFPEVIKHLRDNGIDVYIGHSNLRKSNASPLGLFTYTLKNFKCLNTTPNEIVAGIMLTSGNRPETFMGMRCLNRNGEFLQLHPENARHPMLRPNTRGSLRKFNLDAVEIHYENLIKQFVDIKRIKDYNVFVFHDARGGVTKQVLTHILGLVSSKRCSIDDVRGHMLPKDRGATHVDALRDVSLHMKKWPMPRSVGLVNNADGSITRVVDENGEPFTQSEVALLLLYHLVENKKRYATIVKAQDISESVDELASRYGLPVINTSFSFHNVAQAIKACKEPVLIGFDGQGGVSLGGSSPNKDGILTNFLLLELMAYSRKPLREVLNQIQSGLVRRYTQKQYVLTTKEPNALWEQVDKWRTWGGKIGEYPINRKSTQVWNNLLQQLPTEPKQAKLFLQDGSSLFIRSVKTSPEQSDVLVDYPSLEKRTTPKANDIRQEEAKRVAEEFEAKLAFTFPQADVQLKPLDLND